VVHVRVLRYQVNVQYPDVHAETGLAVPKEVRRLRGVGDVVRCVEVAHGLEVLDEHVAGRFHFELNFCLKISEMLIND